jgi:hypothetical protein
MIRRITNCLLQKQFLGGYSFVAALLVMSCTTAFGSKMSTQNRFVKGEVNDAGRVVWYALNGPNGPYPISYNPSNSESFLTVMIDGKTYTNSDIGPKYPAPPDFYLDAFSPQNTRLLSRAGDGKDTIRTVWKIGQIDVVQDIYPFEFEKSGQIVIRVRMQNHGNVPASAAAQYLLDIDVDNDKAKVLTRWGYSPNWNQYQDPPSPPVQGVPWFFMGFKDPLPPGAGGESSTGYLDKAEEELMKPWRVTIGDWNTLVDWTWGPPPIQNVEYKDDAILMEWPANAVPSSKADGSPGVVELMRTSYGTGEFEICSGQLMAISFYPHKLKCVGSSNYTPNPFELESLIFNTDQGKTASAVNINLHVTDPLTILGPSPVRNGGKDCEQGPAGGAIGPLGVADLIWQLQSTVVTGCSANLEANLSLTATAQGLGMPTMGECEMPLTIECCDQDKVPPRFDSFQGTVFDSSFKVRDNLANDKGLKDITWNVSSGSAANFPVSVTPGKPISDCPKTDYAVSVMQLDSTQGGCLDFTFTDCANNVAYYSMCFKAHSVATHPDVVKPVITQIGWYHWPTIRRQLDSSKLCTAQIDTFRVTDIAQYDNGLKRIYVVGSPVNMTFRALPFTQGAGTAGFAVNVTDSMLDGSITVAAEDIAGNSDTSTIVYCTTPDYLPPQIRSSSLVNYAWHVIVTDSQEWDRGLANIFISNMTNVNVVPMPTAATVSGQKKFEFDVIVIDPAKDAGMCDSAVDLAGNSSAKFGNCLFYKGQTDLWKPNIVTTPSLSTNPSSIQVAVDDIHLNSPGDTIRYDSGIDSVWFTGVYNMTLKIGSNTYVDAPGGPHDVFPAIHNPQGTGLHPFASTVPVFTLTVTDTAGIDSLACVTIHAVDGRQVRDNDGVNQTDLSWCYPLELDSLAPLMTGTSPDRGHIQLHITDDRLKDRGLRQIQTKSVVNFDPLPGSSAGVLQYNGDLATDITLSVTKPGTSAVASIEALDVFGSKMSSPAVRQQHTSSADLWIYAQNLKTKAPRLLLQSGDFDVPIYLDSTDAVPLLQKQIGQYQFGFHIDGGNLINFTQPVTAATMSAGWNVVATPGANRSFTISGTAAPAGTVLSGTPGATYAGSAGALPLLILRFHGDSSESTMLSTIAIDGELGAEVSYNGGGHQILTGVNSVVDIPKPYGTVNGGNIVLKGYCSPVIGSGTKPSVIALERVVPSPATKGIDPRIVSEYTIPETDVAAMHVIVELWSITGEKIETLVDQEQPGGRYRLEVPTTNLSQGSYIIRLVADHTILSRRVVVR